MSDGNKHVVLIIGPPNTGKSTSLMNLKNQDEFIYMNTDLKALPFQHKFMADMMISDPLEVLTYIDEIEATPSVKGGVLDTITFLMGMYERLYVKTSPDTQKAWGQYGDFYRDFIHRIKSGSKDYAIMGHTDTVYDEVTLQNVTKVPIKGAVGKIGVEADFTTILSTKQITIKQLEKVKNFENDLLHITDNEREDGFKYVFQTRVVSTSLGEKMRSAMGLWNRNELYIDNDLGQVFDRLRQYYP
jgi:hypothetical protein